MFTYLIRSENNLFKIGQSKCPEKRLKTLRIGNPKLRLIAYGKSISEKELHEIYRSKRIEGEWYRLNQEDVINVIKLLKNDYMPISDISLGNLYYIISFGKHKGKYLKDMNESSEIQYIKWYVGIKSKKKYVVKIQTIFKWWLNNRKLINATSVEKKLKEIDNDKLKCYYFQHNKMKYILNHDKLMPRF